jgi:hypothetical protein
MRDPNLLPIWDRLMGSRSISRMFLSRNAPGGALGSLALDRCEEEGNAWREALSTWSSGTVMSDGPRSILPKSAPSPFRLLESGNHA